MKPVLFYTILNRYYTVSTPAVMAVTHVGSRGRLYGRYMDNSPTSAAKEAAHGQFKTADEVSCFVKRITDVREEYGKVLKPLDTEAHRLRQEMKHKIIGILSEAHSFVVSK